MRIGSSLGNSIPKFPGFFGPMLIGKTPCRKARIAGDSALNGHLALAVREIFKLPIECFVVVIAAAGHICPSLA
jgi:hypothetical protein